MPEIFPGAIGIPWSFASLTFIVANFLKKLEQQKGLPQIPQPSINEVSSLTPMCLKSILTRVKTWVKSFSKPLKSTLSGAV